MPNPTWAQCPKPVLGAVQVAECSVVRNCDAVLCVHGLDEQVWWKLLTTWRKHRLSVPETRAGPQVLAALAAGELDLVVGTHALISEDVGYARLGLAIVDEQHRFGVEQRARLAAKARPPPHVLFMTATPIPRTLALLAHGDLTHAAIDGLPPGRAPVATRVLVATEANRAQV